MSFKNKYLKNQILDNYLKLSIIFSNVNQLYISNYTNIQQINNDEIIIDNLIIKGNNLKINNLDDYQIKIVGLFSEVKYLEQEI